MKDLLILSVLLFSLPSLAEPIQNLRCSDQSFAYQALSIELDSDEVKIQIGGVLAGFRDMPPVLKNTYERGDFEFTLPSEKCSMAKEDMHILYCRGENVMVKNLGMVKRLDLVSSKVTRKIYQTGLTETYLATLTMLMPDDSKEYVQINRLICPSQH